MGKLTDLSTKDYNDQVLRNEGFEYLDNHRIQGRFIIVAPFAAEIDREDGGLFFSEEEEYIDERTHKKHTKPKEQYFQEQGVVVKIGKKAAEDMETMGYDVKVGDVINFSMGNSMTRQYVVHRYTLNPIAEDHYLCKLVLSDIESVIETK
jgi:co-chaperonin GroES (HSP10)